MKRVSLWWAPLALVAAISPDALAQKAQADTCSQAGNPVAPDKKTATNSTADAIVLSNDGTRGCQQSTDQTGNNGFRGQPGGDSEQTVTPAAGAPGVLNGKVGATSRGGRGGDGQNQSRKTGGASGGFPGGGAPAGNATLTFTGTINDASTSAAISVLSTGGQGGAGGAAEAPLGTARGRDAAPGANGAVATLTANTAISKSKLGDAIAAEIDGSGGDGGLAPESSGAGGNAGNGANGGNAGSAEATIDGLSEGDASVIEGSIIARANGGDGGSGGRFPAGIGEAKSGNGGAGGNGGFTTLTIGATADVQVKASSDTVDDHAGLWITTNGGLGGRGGDVSAPVGTAGSGGPGGNAGSTTLFHGGSVTTVGTHLHGALIQSIGGGGDGGGSSSGFFYSGGGTGGSGGKAGPVVAEISSNAKIRVEGESSFALKAQSIGGGGGSGGDAVAITPVGAAVALGGNAGVGGSGGAVTVDLGEESLITSINPDTPHETVAGGGVLAQSVGGAGGSGGSAMAFGGGNLALSIGNQGKEGAKAGAVTINSTGAIVTTYGDHAVGLDAQSVGGGGGKGGSAFSLTVGESIAAAVAIGGKGGAGGPGGDAVITNSGQVVTYGPNAPGIKSKSVGGGGGHGGAALSTAFAISQAEVVPSISVSVALGGDGGTGNTGGTASIDNSGFVATGGHGAQALVAQSVGGGGGYGGDSSTAAFSGGGGDIKVSASVTLGGQGGGGSTGGTVDVTNEGFLATYGQDAQAIVAQSVGGGGGIGGASDGSGSTDEADKFSFTASIDIGGSAGGGSHGGEVTVTNSGGIGTRGDRADGILAQSIGGSGGAGGGGAGSAAADNLSIVTTVGGKGGAGSDGGKVNVSNTNTIATSGFQAIGINAQSIGGGGGTGGKAAAVGGGAGKAPPAPALESSLDDTDGADEIEPGVIKIKSVEFDADDLDPDQIYELVKPREEEEEDEDEALSLTLTAGVGGSGGAAGTGGTVQIESAGEIVTTGAYSDAIFAQSIGGGGGSAGATSASSSDDNDSTFSLTVGGSGNAGGDGGGVIVETQPGNNITTSGIYAHGVFAQSIGGGGGKSALTAAANAAGLTGGRGIGFALGGASGSSGEGGGVQINHLAGQIATQGKAAVGILAQSIGGGGGVAQASTTDDVKRDADNSLADKFNFSLTVGEAGVSAGRGGVVDILVGSDPILEGPAISTEGRNAHGVLAQSFGGTGGAAFGGTTDGLNFFAGGGTGSGNDGGQIVIDVESDIATSGAGGYGILAQSIGGGGVLGGDLAGIEYDASPDGYLLPFNNTPTGEGNSGDGGQVDITIEGATVSTGNELAPAIFVQSLGGGGGHVSSTGPDPSTDQGIRSGTYGGDGIGGKVTITVGTRGFPAQVTAGGDDAISAQSDGGLGGAPITVNVGPGSLVAGAGGSSSTIRLRGGSSAEGAPNVINNAGTIKPLAGLADEIALWVDSDTTLVNSGSLTGQICGPVTGNTRPEDKCSDDETVSDLSPVADAAERAVAVENRSSGRIEMGPVMHLGSDGGLVNRGILEIGTVGDQAATRLTGDLEHRSSGVLYLDVDTNSESHDQLSVEGDVDLRGSVAVRPVTLGPAELPVLHVTGDISRTADFAVTDTHIFDYGLPQDGGTLSLTVDADFTGAAGARSGSASLAGHLQDIWETDAEGFGRVFADLASVDNADSWADTLDVLSGRAVSAVAAARLESSARLVDSVFSCPVFVGDTALLSERSCAWMRVETSHFERDASGDNVDYSGNATTTMLGGQREIAPGWFLGGVIGYENSRVDSDLGATDVDGDAGLAVFALKSQRGPLVLSGAVDFGYGSFDSDRTIALGGDTRTASASSDAMNAGLHLRAAYQAVRGNWYLQPSVDLDAIYLRLDGYEEQGAGAFDLDVETSDDTVLTLTPAARLGRRIQLESGALLNAYAEAGISFSSGTSWETTARFADAPSAANDFTSELETPDTIGRINVGIEVFETGRLNLQAEYQADVAEDYLSQSGQIRLSWLF
ncbi:MAG: autotransporter outer membrane beta-barrel domain-containing protein [Pseudomonadota bacterium]